MAPTMKAILEMDVAALKAACEEAGLAIKEERKPILQETHECIDLEAEDVRNEIMEIRMDKARYATTNNDARDVIEASR